MTLEEAWNEVLDAIECNTGAEEPCLLLEGAIQDAMKAVLDAASKAPDRAGPKWWASLRAQIGSLGE